MRTRVRQAETEERAARGRVAMRRALALEIRQERHAVGAWRNRRGLGIQARLASGALRELTRELIAIPRERAARREHRRP